MEQSPSWEADSFPASQKNSPTFYGTRRFITTVTSFASQYIFTARSCRHLAQPPSWRTTPCRLSAIIYSIYSQLPSILEAVPTSATWGRAMPWWQGPTHHGILHLLMVRLHHEELYGLFFSRDIIRVMIKWRSLRKVGHVACVRQ